MERLGEPFIFGVEDAKEWLRRFQLVVETDDDARMYFRDLRDQPVYPLYRSAVAWRSAREEEHPAKISDATTAELVNAK
jgi:hypothetical protein